MSHFALMSINQNTEKMIQQFQCISIYLGRCEKEETILLYLLLCVLGLFTTQSVHCPIVSSVVTCHPFKSAPPCLYRYHCSPSSSAPGGGLSGERWTHEAESDELLMR